MVHIIALLSVLRSGIFSASSPLSFIVSPFTFHKAWVWVVIILFVFLFLSILLLTNFNDIPGSGANGAIIHYKPEPESCSVVNEKKLFLLDSGAQYVDGTTDITRTVHFGAPSPHQKDCFTRVLQVPKKFLRVS